MIDYTDYMLEIEYTDGRKKYFHDIVDITFYAHSIRMKDIDGIIITIDIRDKKSVKICPLEAPELSINDVESEVQDEDK